MEDSPVEEKPASEEKGHTSGLQMGAEIVPEKADGSGRPKTRLSVGRINQPVKAKVTGDFNLNEWFGGEQDPSKKKPADTATPDEKAEGGKQAHRPVTKTFAKLLINQEQYDLALDTLKKLKKANPDDAEIESLMKKVEKQLENGSGEQK